MLSTKKLTVSFINKLFKNTNNIYCSNYLQNKILINAFFEPSTRTSCSFESAMYKLGGKVITFKQETSSIQKGESFLDTIKTLATFGDILVLRHSDVNKIEEADSHLNIPIINGGNGNGEHPTQALLDLYTIHKHLYDIKFHHPIAYLSKNNNSLQVSKVLRFLFIGDIKNSRTIHSLLDLLVKFENVNINILPYSGCEPNYGIKIKIYTNNLNQSIDTSSFIQSIDNIDISQYDIIYVTRLQKERETNNKSQNIIINRSFMNKVKKTAIIMHPLPRNEEIDPEIDDDPRCVYFKQMEYGVRIRMALLNMFLS